MHSKGKRRGQDFTAILGMLAAALLLAAGCAGQDASPPAAGPAPQTKSPPPAFPGSPASLPELSRVASSLDISLDRYLNGAEYDAQLSSSRVESAGSFALLSPAFIPGASELEAAAFCVYRIRCYQQAEEGMLQLKWNVAPAEAGSCFIGLSNWPGARWEWHSLPAEDAPLAIAPGEFANEFHQGLVAVVVLGEEAAELKSIECSCSPDLTEEFTLFSPMGQSETFLINMEKEVVHSWQSQFDPGFSVYLMEDQSLLRATVTGTNELKGSGNAGGIERLDMQSNVLWSVDLGSDGLSTHHDIRPMPNGNILVLVCEFMSGEEAVENGRNPATMGTLGVWTECVYELRPLGSDGYEIVWEWHMKDHLVQDFDPEKANFGDVREESGRLDFNYAAGITPDWTHVNSVDYNPERDEIAISVSMFNEIMLIDHSTTTAEAATDSGGRHGRGGEIIFRWGNNLAFQVGFPSDQKLFQQHDANWIDPGLPGEGKLLVFSNRERIPPSTIFSSVVEVNPVINPDGSYQVIADRYQPLQPDWKFVHDPPQGLSSSILSGAQRLRSGNTLITEGASGRLLEVTADKLVVWEYQYEDPETNLPNIFRAYRYELFTPFFEFNGGQSG